MDTESILYFTDEVAVWILGVLIFLYLGQIAWAINDSLKPIAITIENEKHDGSYIDVQVKLYACLKFFDGGLRNMWVFFIIAFFLPVALTSMAELVPLFQNEQDPLEFDLLFQGNKEPSPKSKLLYIVCVGCIGVLMTLEFSYLHTLRKSAAEWVPMLLAALALDLMVLLVLNFVVKNPALWGTYSPAPATVGALSIATSIAILSSFCVLVLARVAGALHDKQIDVSKVIEAESIRYKKLKISKERNAKPE